MFENFSALILLLILLPLIILYILRPKPKTIKIPSLMLLLPAGQKRRLKSLFQTLVRDPLLLIQCIAIALMVIALANPYFLGSAHYERAVIVLDSSASMGSTDVAPSRFAQAVNIAREYIGNSEKISVVLAGDTPLLLLKDGDSQEALAALKQLKSKATGTDLNDAMLFAFDVLGGEKGKIAVVSDFSGQDVALARKIIDEKNIPVEYRQVGAGGNNLGFVDSVIDGNNVKFYVKNYNNVPMDIRINVIQGNRRESINRTIEQNSRDFFVVSNISGTARIVIEPDDDLSVDNLLFISMPGLTSRKVLLLGDSADKKSPLSIALNSIPGLDVREVSFNRAPRKPDYGMVVLHDYTKNSLLPGAMDDLRNYVESGGMLVIQASSELQFMDIKELLPVNVGDKAKPSRFEVRKSELTADVDFGISSYLNATLKEKAVAFAYGEEGPVLAYWNMGRGKVMYLGINVNWGDFHLRTSYPVFWFKLLKFANPAPEDSNYKTGTVLPLGYLKNVQGPGSNIETSNLYLDEVGFYTIEGQTIAANLLDEKESDIAVKKIDTIENKSVSSSKEDKVHLNTLLSILAILLIAVELYYLRYRGEI